MSESDVNRAIVGTAFTGWGAGRGDFFGLWAVCAPPFTPDKLLEAYRDA